MSALDAKLTARCAQLRQEIAQTEAAQPPIADLIAVAVADLDAATEAFRRAPFRIETFALDGRAPTRQAERMIAGAFGALMPKETRQAIERAARESAEATKALRMPPAEKERRLVELCQALRVAEAALEVERRRIEHEDNTVLPRDVTADPGVWLLTDDALRRVADGRTR
jgi:hypothetical protein